MPFSHAVFPAYFTQSGAGFQAAVQPPVRQLSKQKAIGTSSRLTRSTSRRARNMAAVAKGYEHARRILLCHAPLIPSRAYAARGRCLQSELFAMSHSRPTRSSSSTAHAQTRGWLARLGLGAEKRQKNAKSEENLVSPNLAPILCQLQPRHSVAFL